MAISLPPKGDADKKIGAHFAPLSVTAQDTPNLTVKIRAGWFYNTNGEVMEYPGGNSPSIVPPGSNARWVIITLNNNGSVVLVNGAVSATPVLPALPSGRMPIAFVYVTSTMTAITNDRIFDARPLFRGADLVPNLATELADRPTFADLNAALDDKADIDGTPSFSFALNNNDDPAANATFVVKRGAGNDVMIRWNESTDLWEVTNDGVVFNAIATVTGTFMPTVPAAVDGNVATFNTGVVEDSGVALSDLATDAELATAIATKLDDFVGTSGNVVIVAGSGTALADGGILLGDLATDVELTAGLALKADIAGDTFTGDITVDNGVDQPITLAQFDPGSSGLLVDRGGPPNAILEWDESTDQWMAGVIGSVFPIQSPNAFALKASAILDFPSIAVNDFEDLTISVPDAVVGDPVSLALPASPAGGVVFNAFVSAADTVTVRATNATQSGAIDPASATYRVIVWQYAEF